MSSQFANFDNELERFKQSPFMDLGIDGWNWSVRQPEWMLDKMIPARSIGMVYGASNSGKTHLVCDLVLNLVGGHTEWMDRALEPGPVVMFSESIGHIKARLMAYRNHKGSAMQNRLHLHPTMGIDPSEIQDMATWIEILPERPKMVVFDTFATAFSVEENDNQSISALIKKLESMILPAIDPNGCILIVHHTSKASDGRSARGASALVGNIDWTINVSWDKDLERTMAAWEKDRWRLLDESPIWAGSSQRVPVVFENGQTDMMVLDWKIVDQEAEEAAREMQKDLKLQEWKDDIKESIQTKKLPVYVHTNRQARVPSGLVPFDMPPSIPTKKHQSMKDWMKKNFEVEPVFTDKGSECGFRVVVSSRSL